MAAERGQRKEGMNEGIVEEVPSWEKVSCLYKTLDNSVAQEEDEEEEDMVESPASAHCEEEEVRCMIQSDMTFNLGR